MSSQTAKPRSNSPFRFKRPASVNGKLPVSSPTSSTSSPHAHGSLPRVSLSSRPSTPAGGSVNQNYRSISLQSVSSSSVSGGSITSPPERMEFSSNKTKENVVVTVRFRPLSAREIQRGDEVAWYADGDTTVRSEYNPSTGYAFDRVFGPATTTRGVYDVAAQHVVSGAMEGMNGTVFAYGVTSSGKTHTMHGDQKSPGIIPLAVKDVFNIIQETPGKEYLLRVSYLEIYNEVINDLLDPAGQNLRIREDAQGTYVEGIKEEVVLSPAHALSLIATGEEHRHVGSNNFNLMSSRSHTIFTLTIESSVCGEGHEGTLSQLNLIDLAGSESSKTETTGLRRKEGSYINKSLLTLGTVISKLTDGKASHIPYRDSKLTRLLQSSLSGRGRVSLICTVTPASSSNEETHNTLKFAHRTKCVEVHASPNKILDEKSLIKKYQKEIMSLKQELEQLKRGIFEKPFIVNNQQDLATLRQQLEAGQVQLQSRLEEEEQAKAALMGRIQRLTKLILVSTKTSVPTIPERTTHRRRYSFGEEELAYLPDRRRTLALEDEDDLNLSGLDLETSGDGKCDSNSGEDISREEKKSKRRGMLAWFKLKKHESLAISPVGSLDAEHFMNGSPMSNIPSTAHIDSPVEGKGSRGKPPRKKSDGPVVDSFPEYTQAGELFSATIHGRRPPPTGTTMADQMDLLREQVKMLAGEVAFCTSALKRLSEQAASNPDDIEVQMQMQKLKDEVQEKRQQMKLLEKRIVGTTENSPPSTSPYELSQTITKLTTQLNEKAFELEIKTADNRILQEQFQAKTVENKTLQETIDTLKGQLQSFMEAKGSLHKKGNFHNEFTRKMGNITESEETNDWLNTYDASRELRGGEAGNNGGLLGRSFPRDASVDSALQSQVLSQAAEIEKLKQEKVRLVEEKEGLQVHSQKLSEEASYAKELATAAAVELKNLAEEVTKLSGQNSKLSHELANTKELALSRITSNGPSKHMPNKAHKDVQPHEEMNGWKVDFPAVIEELKKDLQVRIEKEIALEALLAEKDKKEAEIQKRMEEAKHREADLENDLASMWVLVAKLRRERTELNDMPTEDIGSNLRDNYVKKLNNLKRLNDGVEGKVGKENMTKEALKFQSVKDQQKIMELELLISQLKSEHLDGLDIPALDDLQNLHVEALTKLCQAKIRAQQRLEAEREGYLQEEVVSRVQTETISGSQFLEDNRNGHVCKVCFEEPSAAVLLPCRHFCLCKSCAVACAECPLCRTGITDRIITFTS